MIRVMLVDDHAVVRVGFRLLIQASGDIEVTTEAESGEVACQRHDPALHDVVVMDITMPGMGGLEAMRRLRLRQASVRILALSAQDDPIHAKRALQLGALSFLSKRSAPEALIQAIRITHSGMRFIDPAVAHALASSRLVDERSPIDSLSEREFEVFIRLARGATVERIARDLNLSSSTIGTHLYHIKQKLSAVNQSELTLIAVRLGLIEA